MNAIEAVDVTKVYRRYARRRHFATLKSALVSGTFLRDLRPDDVFPAVKHVTFNVPAGATYGIIGRNGSGKSTMLKLVAGITKPTSGSVRVAGRISALIELGAGFHPEISGRENVFINAVMLGLTKREIARRFDEIVEFAELEDFIDAPVKTYSSGMYMRLGFAVAINVDPDVLLVDEVLAVGDEGFTHKCLDKFAEFRRRGKTILLVTHALSLVERFCDEALWLDAGEVRGGGDTRRVVAAYISDVTKSEEVELAAGDAKARAVAAQAHRPGPEQALRPGSGQAAEPAESGPAPAPAPETPPSDEGASLSKDEGPVDMSKATEGRWGSREVEIAAVELVGDSGQPGHIFGTGERMSIRMTIRAARPVDDVVFGVGIFNAEGTCVFGTNTEIERYESERVEGDGTVTFQIDSLDLVAGTYKLDVAAHRRDGYQYDYHRLLYSFRVKSPVGDVGIYRPRHAWTFSANVALRPPRRTE